MNINQQCHLILTERGAKYLNSYNKAKQDQFNIIFNRLGAAKQDLEKTFPTNYKAGDSLELSLWEIMNKFGNYFDASTEAPFVNNEITYEDN